MKKEPNYEMISLVQFVLALLVIMLHCSRVFQNDVYHFIQKSLFSRTAVPFFIVCSSYLIRMKSHNNPLYERNYIKKYIKSYLIWSMIYIPYGFFYFTTLSLPTYLIPIGFVFAIIYIGLCYHLWYLPAYLTGFYLVKYAHRRIQLKYVFIFFLGLYVVGSIETYSAFFEDTQALSAYLDYATLFITSRNGLFYAPVFICLGYILYDYREATFLTRNPLVKVLLSLFILCIEGYLLFPNQGMDKNFLLALIPLSLFLFNWLIRTDVFRNKSFYKLKQLSTLYFFIHPIFIEVINLPIIQKGFHPSFFGWVVFLFTLLFTHMASILVLQASKRVQQMKRTNLFSKS